MNQTARKLLTLLLKGPQLQKDLPQLLNVKRPTVKYHVDRLEQAGLIRKKLVAKAGPIKVVEIELVKLALPQIRAILHLPITKRTLISGFTYDPRIQDKDTLTLPDISRRLLEQEGTNIDKLICFTTPLAMRERKKANLPPIDRYITYPFKTYQDPTFAQIIKKELANELLTAEIIIDITPLTKIYTITMQHLAHQFKFPIIYVARDDHSFRLIHF
ncbi:MAG: ArsR/SmtB family transcription factor [Candidatus Helarchaeota archaeon]